MAFSPPEIDIASLPERFRSAAAEIRFLLLDVDGILTDGQLRFDPDGRECKYVHAHDASGIVHWKRAGHEAGMLSGRHSRGIQERADELGMQEVHLGKLEKGRVFDEILERRGLRADEVCYFGDDVLDMPVLERVGMPVTVAQARPYVRDLCCYVTQAPAGHGAVREVIELVLKLQGRFDEVIRGDISRS